MRLSTLSAAQVNMIGYVAATMTTGSFVPQLVRVVRLRSARDISLTMFVIFSLGAFLWLVYGVLVQSWPVTAANLVTFLLAFTILMLKLRFDRRATEPLSADVVDEGSR